MSKFTPVRLTRYFNAPAQLRSRPRARQPRWHRAAEEQCAHLPRRKQSFWGIPFLLGPRDLMKRGLIVLAGDGEVRIAVTGRATHVCLAHFCDARSEFAANAAGGEHVADYTLCYADGKRRTQAIRRRFEINPFGAMWGGAPFAAVGQSMPTVAPDDPTAIGWGPLQTGVARGGWGRFAVWVYALENPRPDVELDAITLRATGDAPVAIAGLTLYDGEGHPLRHVPREVYRVTLPAREKVPAAEFAAELDLGVVTRTYAAPAAPDESWLKAVERGLGEAAPADVPRRRFLVEATGSEGATLTVQAGQAGHEVSLGEAYRTGKASSSDGRVRVERVHGRKTWLHVTVVDGQTDRPTPTRVHFRGPNGEYLPPYGHHAVVNDRWFEDYGGDLKLGGTSYAYVPGRFQIELPVGEVYVELSKGFEYTPVRRCLRIRPGQRELKLTIRRWADQRREGWVTADTHVHFISPQTAWLEGQGEGVNLINLLASQWGRLFTNVADITGALSGCSQDDTLVWVGTENRHHLLGHMSLLGAQGDPVYPMCTGGPHEAYLGDPDVTTLTDWAQTVRERSGVSIRPHFPAPVCEEPCYFLLEELDGAELRQYANPESGTLDEFCFREWYRYLNCGCRVAAVGGTDKMSAGMPVGGARTYARLAPDDEFTFANWGKAVRAGRTYTSSGPIIDLAVDGHGIGDEIQMPQGGGTVEVHARARCVWPIHTLEVVVNGRVVAKTSSTKGAKSLSLKRAIRLAGSSWVAARCGSRLRVQHCWPIHLGAHTSPVYVVAGGEPMFSPPDAQYMLTLIDGGMTWLDTLSIRYDERRHRQLKAVFRRARRELQRRQDAHERYHQRGGAPG